MHKSAALVGALVAGPVLVHAWMAAEYGTVRPCEAAVERMTGMVMQPALREMTEKLKDNPFAGLALAITPKLIDAAKPLFSQMMREKGLAACYEVTFGLRDTQLQSIIDNNISRNFAAAR